MSLQADFAGSKNNETLTVRFSTAADAPKIIDFYNAALHEHVDKRPDTVLWNRAGQGQVLMIEDSKGDLRASSIAYEFNKTAGRDPAFLSTWVEFGSTRSTLSGVSLYPFIVATQVIERFLAYPPEDKFIAAIYKDNQPVTDFLNKKVGWSFFTPDAELADATDLTKDLGKLNCLEAASTSLPHQARIVLDYMERGTTIGLDNRKTGEKVMLDVRKLTLSKFWRSAVEEIAHGAFGKALEAGPPMPMGAARRLLEKHLNASICAPQPGLKP